MRNVNFKPLVVFAFFSLALVQCHASSDQIKGQQDVEQLNDQCGWFVNPVPNEVTFITEGGKWIISRQGGHEAEGDWPDFSDRQWKSTNSGGYGYGCACLDMTVQREAKLVIKINRVKAQSLDLCKKDRRLPGVE